MARSSLKNICRLIDQVNEDMPIEQSFLTDLKKSVELEAKATSRKPSQTYKPSSMKCMRNMYFQRIGANADEDLPSYCSVGICNSGSDIHLRTQDAVAKMKTHGIDCEYIDVEDYINSRNLDNIEVKGKSGVETKLFHKELNMSFMCDGIVKYKGKYYILEIKSEASFKWSARTYVDASHYNQGTAYSVALRISGVLFLYVNRDILDMKCYMFIPSDDMKQDLIGMISECESYVKTETIPPKADDIPKKVCEYCSYKKLCKENL